MKRMNENATKHFYDEYWASDYSAREKVMREWWRPAFDHLHAALGNLDGKTVIEIGAGDGRHAREPVFAGANVIAVDFSASALNLIKSGAGDLNITPVAADAHKLPFRNESADVLLLINMLMFTDRKTVMEECRRVVKTGGAVAFLEPLRYPHILMLARLFERHSRKTKFSFLTAAEARRLGAAFSKAEHREFLLLSAFPVIAARLFPNSRAATVATAAAARLDSALVGALGILRHFCYLTVAVFEK